MVFSVASHPGRPFTYADLENTPDDGYRYEIIGGSLIVTPAPSGGHQLASAWLVRHLSTAATEHSIVLAAPYDWKLPDGGSVAPDLVVIDRADFDSGGPLASSATPLLVVQILSPGNAMQDLAVKRELYQRLGVPGYWIVDAAAPSLLALALVAGAYETAADVTGADQFVTNRPFPLQFAPVDLTR